MANLGRRLLPHPFLSLLLVLVWCLLVGSYALGSIIFAVILALVIPIVTAAYWPDSPPTPKPFKFFVYILLVLWDIVVANVTVAMIILFKSNKSMHSNWVVVPLDLRTPEAITILAGTITLTPGTVSADLSSEGHCLLVHALDAEDPEAEARNIKHRYERRLKEIFE